MGVTVLVLLALICGTMAVPLVRERRQYAMQYSSPYSGVAYSPYGAPQETVCQQRYRLSEPQWTKPVCNIDGSFREYQCEPYSRSKCWCVYDNGMMIPDSAMDIGDPEQEHTKLNCPIKRASAPKPAPKPPPIPTPYQDSRIGWHLAYRDAAMQNNPYAYLGYYGGYPSAGYAANSYYPQQPAAAAYTGQSQNILGMTSVQGAPPSYNAGCPDPCPPPCSCVPGTYRASLPHAGKPLSVIPANPAHVADADEDDEPEDEEESGDELQEDDKEQAEDDDPDKKEDEEENTEEDEKETDKDEDDLTVEKNKEDDKPIKETETKGNEEKPDKSPVKQEDKKKAGETVDELSADKKVKPAKQEDKAENAAEKKEDKISKVKAILKKEIAKKLHQHKDKQAKKKGKKNDKPAKKDKNMVGIDGEDEDED